MNAVSCPHCQTMMSFRAEHAGMHLGCPKCKGAVMAPPMAILIGPADRRPTVRFSCPSCGRAVSDGWHAGEKGDCPSCGQRVQAPSPNNKTVLGRPLEEDTRASLPQAQLLPSSPFVSPPTYYPHQGFAEPTAQQAPADPQGVIGVTLGSVALASSILAPLVCGMGFFLAIPLGIGGLTVGLFSKGSFRTVAIAMNVSALVLGGLGVMLIVLLIAASK